MFLSKFHGSGLDIHSQFNENQSVGGKRDQCLIKFRRTLHMTFISISSNFQNCFHVTVSVQNAIELLYHFYWTSIEFLCKIHGISTVFPRKLQKFQWISLGISIELEMNFRRISPPVTYIMIRIWIEISRKYELTDFHRIAMEWASGSFVANSQRVTSRWSEVSVHIWMWLPRGGISYWGHRC